MLPTYFFPSGQDSKHSRQILKIIPLHLHKSFFVRTHSDYCDWSTHIDMWLLPGPHSELCCRLNKMSLKMSRSTYTWVMLPQFSIHVCNSLEPVDYTTIKTIELETSSLSSSLLNWLKLPGIRFILLDSLDKPRFLFLSFLYFWKRYWLLPWMS